MMRAFDTLVARLLLVSLIGITMVHGLSLWTYEHALDRELTLANETRLAERLIAIKRSVMLVAPAQRDAVAHDLSGGPLAAHWSATEHAIAGGPGSDAWRGLAARLRDLAADIAASDVVIGTVSDQHRALVSIRLPDDGWINFNLFAASTPTASGHGTLISTSLMALGVALMSLLLARWLTRPIRRIAEAAASLMPGQDAPPVPETGPKEVRDLATAFNEMRRRITDLIARRTRSLAAVSHDLRTPLTRLKLRLDDVPDRDLRRAMASDVDEMEQMIEATLSYLKGDEQAEPRRSIDLVALLETIVDDAHDSGRSAALKGPSHVVINARLGGLKRAFSNLIGNALRFGSVVSVSIEPAEADMLVTIDDDGPGIPDRQLHAVLEPFVRLEDSRNRETGGVGLGLTIAKANIEADGGTLTLSNRPEGGLRAVVRLPRLIG